MKLISTSASCLILGLFSFAVVANSPVKNVDVYSTEASTLSIQNLSKYIVSIDLYGEILDMKPASGIQFECTGYDSLELQIKNNEHDYFEVPCKSRVVINELFTNQYPQGK